jgi:hypothetical protein
MAMTCRRPRGPIRERDPAFLRSRLGRGGLAALAGALAQLRGEANPRTIGRWARLGDVIAHGGVASALDSQ